MRTTSTTVLLCVALLAGCGAEPGASVAAHAADASAAATDNAAGTDAVAATDAATPAAAPRYVFGFTSIAEGEDPRIVEWAEDPCGVTAFAPVDAMPVEDPTLLPDWVVEFDADGSEVRRWAKPYSAEIVAIAGERLHFRADHEARPRVFWTQPDGTLGLIDDRLANPAAPPATGFADGATEVECPALPAFEGSDYVQCFEIADGENRRRVAFEGACS